MKRTRHTLLNVIALAVFVAGMAMSARADATIYRDCFMIIPGQIPHLSCTVPGLEGIDYAVDKYESNNWNVVIHGWGMDDPRIKVAKPGEHYVDDNDMPAGVYEVTGTSQPFVFEFCNWYRSEVLGSHTWYGYVSIALDNNGQLVILESAICNEQNVLTVVGMASGQGSAFLNPETGCETNCFDTVSDNPPHIVYRSDRAIDFTIDRYTENCWLVTARYQRGTGYVKQVPAGTFVNDSVFSEGRTSDGYDNGNLFFIAFKWLPDVNDTVSHVRYGWLAIGFLNGAPSVLASEMAETENAALVGRGFQGVDDGPDAQVDGLIWRCNFNNGVQWISITDLTEVASHVILAGEDIEATIDNGSYSGRRCTEINGSSGERAWFFVNAKAREGRGERYVPGKWQSLRTSFKLKSNVGCRSSDEMYGTIPEFGNDNSPKLRRIIRVPGSVVNLDDKIALRYCDYELSYYEPTYFWQINAGVTNAAGVLEARTVRLAAKERWSELASPIGNWITVEIETVNDGSPKGLAYRIFINGVLACSEDDGATVFRARPQAADRTGVSALGIGGMAYVDDVAFSSVATNPFASVYISPDRFGPANEELTAEELDVLAGIIGFESLSGLERITMYPWEDDSGCEPFDAAKTCIDLGISPFHMKPDSDDGKGLMLFFKNPTAVRAIGIDPIVRTVTGQVVPAEGTRIVQPPQRFMFGINHHMDFGTPYAHIEEHGSEMYWYSEKFTLDFSNYTKSNGVFTITYDPKFSDEDSVFFSLSIKDYRYW